MKRVLTALLLIPVILALNFLAPAPAVWAVLVLVALLALAEFFAISRKLGMSPFSVPAYGVGGSVIFFPNLPEPAFIVVVTALLFLLALNRSQPLSRILGDVASTLLGVIYVCGPFALARELHAASAHWLFFVLLLNWVGDSMAYYAGRALGRHRLAPTISPLKTWEGSVASVISAGAVGSAYLTYFQPAPLSLAGAIVLAVAVNIAAQLGDLAESALKRGAALKDSGSLLPGHGGILDRTDGLLFSLPACYFMVVWLF